MRTKIINHSGLGMEIFRNEFPNQRVLFSNITLDEKWKMLEQSVYNENSKRLLRYRENVESKMIKLSNATSSNNLEELKGAILEAADFRKYYDFLRDEDKEILLWSDNLGNELWLKNYDKKASERIEAIKNLIFVLNEKIKIVEIEEKKSFETNICDVVESLQPYLIEENEGIKLKKLLSGKEVKELINWKGPANSLVTEIIGFMNKGFLKYYSNKNMEPADLRSLILKHFTVKGKTPNSKTLRNCISNLYSKK